MEGPQMASGKNDTCIVKVKMIVFLYDILFTIVLSEFMPINGCFVTFSFSL
jgi:hypothetical protein